MGAATLASVTAKMHEHEQLRGMLREACCGDDALVSAVMREA